jgi:hypothetical protein
MWCGVCAATQRHRIVTSAGVGSGRREAAFGAARQDICHLPGWCCHQIKTAAPDHGYTAAVSLRPLQGNTMNTTRLHRIAAAALLLSGLAAVLPARAQGQQDDAALASSVKAALLQAAPFKDADVDLAVTASNGVVTLSGWVSYVADEPFAAQIASSVGGVKAVKTALHAWSTEADYRI